MSDKKYDVVLPGLVSFGLCTLNDIELAEKAAKLLNAAYTPPVQLPYRSIPAKPDADFDLIFGELIKRFLDKTTKIKE